MALTIDDICDKEFRKVSSGYDPDEVDGFLDDIMDEIQRLLDENEALNSKLSSVQQDLEMERNAAKPAAAAPAQPAPEATASTALEGILRQAQVFADKEMAEARAKAERIIQDAKDEATATVDAAQQEKGLLAEKNESLRSSVKAYREDFLSLLKKYQNMLNEEGLFTR